MVKKAGIILIIVFNMLMGTKEISFATETYESVFAQGSTFIRKQMYPEALDAYEKAIQLKPDAFEA